MACWLATSRNTIISAGIPGCLLEAVNVDLLLAEGLPTPALRYSFRKSDGLFAPQSMAIPIPPTTAIAGVALKMNLPALEAMSPTTIVQEPRKRWLCLPFSLSHNRTTAQKNSDNCDYRPIRGEQYPSAWCLCLTDSSENLVLGEVESTGEQDIPSIVPFQFLKNIKGHENCTK